MALWSCDRQPTYHCNLTQGICSDEQYNLVAERTVYEISLSLLIFLSLATAAYILDFINILHQITITTQWYRRWQKPAVRTENKCDNCMVSCTKWWFNNGDYCVFSATGLSFIFRCAIWFHTSRPVLPSTGVLYIYSLILYSVILIK